MSSNMNSVDLNVLFDRSSELTGLPWFIITPAFILYVIIFAVIIITGFSIWFSKCYNIPIKLAIVLAILSQIWYFIYFNLFIGENSNVQEIFNAFKLFTYIVVLITMILSYGMYKQVTGKCALLGN